MPQDIPSAHEVVSNFEKATDAQSFQTAFQSAVLLNNSDQASWKDAQSQLQSTDLSAIGLGGFTIDGVENQPKDASGNTLAPELDLKPTSGNGPDQRVDAQGDVFDQSGVAIGKLQFNGSSDSTASTAGAGGQPEGAAHTTSDQSTSPAAPPAGQDAGAGAGPASTPGSDGSQAGADTPPPPSSDAGAGGGGGAGSDSAAPQPFGPNGRQMEMSADGTSGVYTVQGGDNLWSIAQDALTPPGQTLTPDQKAAMAPEILQMVNQIATDNNISDPNEIQPGQQLTINGLKPSSDSTGQPASTTPSDGASSSTTPNDGTPTPVAPTTPGDGSSTPAAPTTPGDGSTSSTTPNDGTTGPAGPTTPGDGSSTPAAPATSGESSTVPAAPAPMPEGNNSFLRGLQAIDGTPYNPLMPQGIQQDLFSGAQATALNGGGELLGLNIPQTDASTPAIQAAEVFDQNGSNLIGSQFIYGGNGVSMEFQNSNGAPQDIANVKEIENIQQQDGTYATKIADAAGDVYTATIDTSGQVTFTGQTTAGDSQQPTTTPPATPLTNN